MSSESMHVCLCVWCKYHVYKQFFLCISRFWGLLCLCESTSFSAPGAPCTPRHPTCKIQSSIRQLPCYGVPNLNTDEEPEGSTSPQEFQLPFPSPSEQRPSEGCNLRFVFLTMKIFLLCQLLAGLCPRVAELSGWMYILINILYVYLQVNINTGGNVQ